MLTYQKQRAFVIFLKRFARINLTAKNAEQLFVFTINSSDKNKTQLLKTLKDAADLITQEVNKKCMYKIAVIPFNTLLSTVILTTHHVHWRSFGLLSIEEKKTEEDIVQAKEAIISFEEYRKIHEENQKLSDENVFLKTTIQTMNKSSTKFNGDVIAAMRKDISDNAEQISRVFEENKILKNKLSDLEGTTVSDTNIKLMNIREKKVPLCIVFLQYVNPQPQTTIFLELAVGEPVDNNTFHEEEEKPKQKLVLQTDNNPTNIPTKVVKLLISALQHQLNRCEEPGEKKEPVALFSLLLFFSVFLICLFQEKKR